MNSRRESFEANTEDNDGRILAAYHALILSKGSRPPSDATQLSGSSDDKLVEEHLGGEELDGALNVLRMMERNRQLTLDEAGDTTFPELPRPPSAIDDVVGDARVISDQQRNQHSIGRFKILKRLGAGGAGIVMLARDPRLERNVALKMPNPHALMNDEFVERFQREARVAAQLKHPNIVTVLETGSVGPICYIATDYCNGPNLSEWLQTRDHPVAPVAAAKLVRALADATHHAHCRGVLHRDIKPANVLFELGDDDLFDSQLTVRPSASNQPILHEDDLAAAARLADFGLAKQLVDSVTITGPVAIVGTPAYMSPEQAAGNVSELGTHSDTFALGVILYELLTGTSPFVRDSPISTLEAVKHDSPSRSRALRSEVPADLDAICCRCLEKLPADRYRTAAALVDDLDRFLVGTPVEARPISTFGRIWRWACRKPFVASLLLTVALLVGTLAIGSSYVAFALSQSRQETLDALANEVTARNAALEKEKVALDAAYEARVAQATSLRRTGEAGQQTDSLSALRSAASLIDELNLGSEAKAELRSEAIASLSLVDLIRETEWKKPTNAFLITRADEACERFARPVGQSRIEICDARTSKVLTLLTPPSGKPTAGAFLFSPDGRYFADRLVRSSSSDMARIWDLRTSKPAILKPIVEFAVSRTPVKMVKREHSPYDFNFDGTECCLVHGKKLRVLSLPSGTELQQVELPAAATTVRFSPDGKRIAVATVRAIHLLERDNLAKMQEINAKPTELPASRLAWSKDGQRLAAAVNRHVQIWDNATGKSKVVLQPLGRKAIDIDFHPYDDIVLTLAGDGTTHLWEGSSGKPILQWPEMRCTHFSSDGQLVASRVGLMRLQRPRQTRLRTPTQTLPIGSPGNVAPIRSAVSEIVFHSGGRLAACGTGSSVFFFDIVRCKPVCRIRAPLERCVFTEDGRWFCGLTKGKLIRFPITVEESDRATQFKIGSAGERVPIGQIPDSWPSVTSNETTQPRFAIVQSGLPSFRFVDRQTGSFYTLNTNKAGGVLSDISPTGIFGATANVRGMVRIWNIHTGEVEQELESIRARVKFQPGSDDPLLAVTELGRLRVFQRSNATGQWEVVHERGPSPGLGIPTYMAFTPDGRYLAQRTSRKTIDLIDMQVFETVASVTMPDGTMAVGIVFSNDGSKMVVGTNEDFYEVWSFDDIDAELHQMNLGLGHESTERDEPRKIEVHWNPSLPES